jgi:NAD(P)-dependent dehydrogenase (short-subunit alcohol dehydrogenase family)
MENYENKIVVVTGGTSGIGKGLALATGKKGARVFITGRNPERGKAAEAELKGAGIDVTFVQQDVTKEEDWKRLAETVTAAGEVSYVFNNAGIMLRARPLSKLTVEDWKWMMDTNFWGDLYGLRTFTDVMMKQEGKGVICTTCSTASVAPFSCWAPYTTSKAATLRLCECYQAEANYFKNDKVRYAAVMPGVVESDISNCECYRPDEYRNEGEPLAERMPTTPIDSIEGRSLGKISVETAVERILKQLDYGHFYIYTHRDLTMGLMTEQFDAMVLNKPITDQLVYDFGYYRKKIMRGMTPEQQKEFLAALEAKKGAASATRPSEE